MAAAAPIGGGTSGTWSVQAGSAPSGTGVSGPASAGVGTAGEEEDVFGEHYFHICIYIWVFVVVSSLIALSVKWGCCGRSLTRWEVKKLPLRKFHRTEGDECHDKCPICHESFHEGRLIRQLPCNHCYHSYCVDRWLVKMSNRCPLCKQRVSISLFCPWTKDRRNKAGGDGGSGSGGQERFSMAELEMEAPVDEAPPVPPLSTLTPNSWYGEDIMSGPSKFVIMRPGRPTRVIDVRENSKTSKAEFDTCGHLETAVRETRLDGCRGEGGDSNLTCGGCCKSQGDLGPAVTNIQDSKVGSSILVLNTTSASPSLCDHNHCRYHHHHIEQHQHLPMHHHQILDELHKSPSNRSSRSCSVSSDLPLLTSSNTSHCQACGAVQRFDEGKLDSSKCVCMCEGSKDDNGKSIAGPYSSIPSATTRLTATPELSRCQLARREGNPSGGRHLQVISLHNQDPLPCPSKLQKGGEDSNLTDCVCDIEPSLSPTSSKSSRPLSLPDETTVCLSSGSSSVLTGSGRSSDRVTTSRLSLPHHSVRATTNPLHPQSEITSMSLDMLPGHRNTFQPRHRSVIDTPITYLGSDMREERKSKDRNHKDSRRKEMKCSVEAIAPVSCHVLLPPELLERQSYPLNTDPLAMAKISDQHNLSSDLKNDLLYKNRGLEEAWQDWSISEPAIQSLPSDAAYQLDSVLTSVPASSVLFSEHSPPPPPARRTHRRSNDYTCKHL
ncbi:E3 ubiquitin-protein ligase RNF13 [Elysia marginata]|uniref:E3 ubiquitin-protein ligase RNF13 n=1 Tax=Elysia marginata TaxID=1093978 RepID=A0AAV4ILE4_9GAST|nr:E3 ubiquitin-protein ligase RNF13 [Elysia marginata]